MTVRDFSTPGQRTAADFGLLLIRLPLGLLFLFAGVNKVKGGVGNFVTQASGAIPSYMPGALGQAYLHALPWVEIVVGVCFIAGCFTRFTGALASLMLISFMMAATGIKDPNGGPFHTNVTLLCIALCLAMVGPGRLSIDGLWPERKKKH